jgi:hypothetical protein
MKTRWTIPGLGLLLILAANCGKDDPLPGPPDAAAKDGGASDAVKADVEIAIDLAAPADTTAPDAAPGLPDTAPADTGAAGSGDTPIAPIVTDANVADSATNPVRLDSGTVPRDTNPSDLTVPQVDVPPDSVARDAPVTDASDVDSGTEG